jgi:arylsulfatase A-like enzyme
VLISIDTLRANHLSAYGYERPTSPNIDAFAETGVLFERVMSQAPWTLPAHVSMLTSLYPTRHRVDGNYKLESETTTIADVLHDDGYRTVAFTAGGWMSRKRNFHTFDEFDDSGREWKLADFNKKPTSFPKMISWLDQDHDEKFFLFWHTKQTHCPYEPDEGFDHFDDASYDGPIEIDGSCSIYFDELVDSVTEEDKQYIRSKYDGAIRTIDHKIGKLLAVLERRGIANRTIIVLTSDHGESFAERGPLRKIGHGIMYDEVTRVPLILRIPGSLQTGRVAYLVETIDIMPTVLDALGLPMPEGIDGRNLFEAGEDSMAFSERHGNDRRSGDEFALRYLDYILIYYEKHDRFELYDLGADPHQRNNLTGASLAVEETMKHQLLTRVARLRANAEASGLEAIPVELDEDDKAQLRALGYLK